MAEIKTDLFDNAVEVSPDDVELNAALATQSSQTLEVGLAEMILRWSDSVR